MRRDPTKLRLLSCPLCHKHVRVSEADAERRVTCYHCTKTIGPLPKDVDKLDPAPAAAPPDGRVAAPTLGGTMVSLGMQVGIWPFMVAALTSLCVASGFQDQAYVQHQIATWWIIATGFAIPMLAIWTLGTTLGRVLGGIALFAAGLVAVLQVGHAGELAAFGLAVGMATGLAMLLWKEARRRRVQGRRHAALQAQWTAMIVTGLIFGALFLGLSDYVRYRPIAARRQQLRVQCAQKLERMGLALGQYHDAYGCFPSAATADASGRPLQSWIAYTLPQMKIGPSTGAYDLAKPWDGPGNLKWTDWRLQEFLCMASSYTVVGQGITHYRMVSSPGSIGGTNRYVRLEDITDGPEQTVIVVEASHDPCPWASPGAVADVGIPINSPGGPGSVHWGGFHALFADGTVRWIPASTDAATLRALATVSGGEQVDMRRFEKWPRP
jgi:uncharacterized protein DUF1559